MLIHVNACLENIINMWENLVVSCVLFGDVTGMPWGCRANAMQLLWDVVGMSWAWWVSRICLGMQRTCLHISWRCRGDVVGIMDMFGDATDMFAHFMEMSWGCRGDNGHVWWNHLDVERCHGYVCICRGDVLEMAWGRHGMANKRHGHVCWCRGDIGKCRGIFDHDVKMSWERRGNVVGMSWGSWTNVVVSWKCLDL